MLSDKELKQYREYAEAAAPFADKKIDMEGPYEAVRFLFWMSPERAVALLDELESLKASQNGGWISVSERKPEAGLLVYAWKQAEANGDDRSHCTMAFWARTEGWGWTKPDGNPANDCWGIITHWQPLPSPPIQPPLPEPQPTQPTIEKE